MLLPGTRLGPYEVLEVLGTGGMGEVYRARDSRLERHVAIKVLPDSLSDGSDRILRFQRETKAIASLHHPNVLAIYDVCLDQTPAFAVMELIEGETLRQHMWRNSLSWRQAVELSVGIVEGLAAAHAKGIVHRDIKPENVMLTQDGQIKILDFGLAKEIVMPRESTVEYAPGLTSGGTILGTFGYMSPEQIRGQNVDARTDLFAIGCLLYEMLLGETPFVHATLADTMAATLQKDPRHRLDDLADIPVQLKAIVQYCLEKDAAQRIPSARVLLQGLNSLLQNPPRPSRTATASSKPGKSHRITVFSLMGAILFAVVLYSSAFMERWSTLKGTIETSQGTPFAVLPIVDTAETEDTGSLADMISEDLINRLTIKSLDVRSIHVVAPFKGEHAIDLIQIGRNLKINQFLSGRLRRQGQSIVLSVSLVDARNGKNIWGAQYPIDFGDMSAVNAQVARKVVDQLGVEVLPEESRRLAGRLTDSAESMRYYLHGRNLFATQKEVDVLQAIEQFKLAAKEDDDFALPYLGLSNSYYWLSNVYRPPSEVMPLALDAAKEAIRRDDLLGDAYALIGFIKLIYEVDRKSAEREFRKAIERCPKSANVHTLYGLFLVQEGRFEEGLAELRKTQELDPLTPEIVGYPALALYMSHRPEQAIRELNETLVRSPQSYSLYAFLGLALESKNELDQAIATFEKLIKEDPNPDGLGQLGHAYALAGKEQAARDVLGKLKEMKSKRFVSSYNFALIEVALGETDKAIASLHQAADERSDWMSFIKVDPRFKPLHSFPAFAEILRRMQLD